MNKPTKYKSIQVSEINNKPVTLLTSAEKLKTSAILTKLIQYIKQKHS